MIIQGKAQKFSIQDRVLSMDFGVGVILAIEKIQTDGDDYYVIEHGGRRSKDYFPVKDNKTIRAISSKVLFEKTLQILKKRKVKKNFESKKDRLQYFERRIDKSNVETIAIRASELFPIEDMNVKEKRIVDKLIETLELEASIIYKKTKNESKELISKFLA